jgi:hypothetical protein
VESQTNGRKARRIRTKDEHKDVTRADITHATQFYSNWSYNCSPKVTSNLYTSHSIVVVLDTNRWACRPSWRSRIDNAGANDQAASSLCACSVVLAVLGPVQFTTPERSAAQPATFPTSITTQINHCSHVPGGSTALHYEEGPRQPRTKHLAGRPLMFAQSYAYTNKSVYKLEKNSLRLSLWSSKLVSLACVAASDIGLHVTATTAPRSKSLPTPKLDKRPLYCYVNPRLNRHGFISSSSQSIRQVNRRQDFAM